MRPQLVIDAGALYALFDADDRRHPAVRAAVREARKPILIPTPALGRVDLLLSLYLEPAASEDLLAAIRNGFFALREPSPADLDRAARALAGPREPGGLVDALALAAAESLPGARLLTVDQQRYHKLGARASLFELKL